MSKVRSKVVDFSPPFETSEIKLLIKKFGNSDGHNDDDENSSNSNSGYGETKSVNFLEPFSPQLWISIFVSYLLTSFLIYFVARLSPYERQRTTTTTRSTTSNGRKNMVDQEYYEAGNGGLTLSNSFWLILTGFFVKSDNSIQHPKVNYVLISYLRMHQ